MVQFVNVKKNLTMVVVLFSCVGFACKGAKVSALSVCARPQIVPNRIFLACERVMTRAKISNQKEPHRI
jgi:hypothetical protein